MLGRQISTLILGAVVLIGCQNTETTAQRMRWAGEMDVVGSSQGLLRISCIKQMVANGASGSEVAKTCGITDSSGKAKSVTDVGPERGRMFHNGNKLYTYLYLPYYYVDYTYTSYYYQPNEPTSYDYNDTNDILCRVLFGRKCWRNDWYNQYFGYEPQTTYQQYNPTCNRWLSADSGAYTSSGYYDYSNFLAPTWNQNWRNCYNAYY